MTVSTGKTGRGITFELSDGNSPTTFVPIANALSIQLSGRDSEEIDFTHLASTGGFREFRQGFKDPGSISIEYHFTPTEASHTTLLTLWDSGALVDWQINFVNAGWNYYLRGTGFVRNPGDINVTVNDPVGGTATVRVSGTTAFVPAP